MASYMNTTFGGSNEYNVYHPSDTELFVFSPYYIEVTGTAANQSISMTVNSITLTRKTNASFKAKFPISKILQSFWAGVDVAEVLFPVFPSQSNAESKLIRLSKAIVIQVGTDTANKGTLTYDLIWGALQSSESYTMPEKDVYMWHDGTSYLVSTITDSVSAFTKGKEIFLSIWASLRTPPLPKKYQLIGGGGAVARTYNIKQMPFCAGGLYLRWIALDGEYKYYYFKIASTYIEQSDIKQIRQNVYDFDSGIYVKSGMTNYSKKAYRVYDIGIPSANYDQQVYLQSLETSLKQYCVEWKEATVRSFVECNVEVEPIMIDRNRLNKEINIKVRIPIYTQTL